MKILSYHRCGLPHWKFSWLITYASSNPAGSNSGKKKPDHATVPVLAVACHIAGDEQITQHLVLCCDVPLHVHAVSDACRAFTNTL